MTRRLDPALLEEMAALLADEDRDEMAIPSYLHKNPALRWMAWRRIEVVGRRIQQRCPPGGTVLDFGCGTGVLFGDALKRAHRVFGMDLVLDAARLLVERRDLGAVTLLHPDQADQIPDHSLDMVVAAEVLEHLDDPADTFAMFRRVLRGDGELLVSLPTENAAYRFGRRLSGFQGDYHEHDAASIDRALQAAGFRPTWGRRIPLPGPATIYVVTAYAPG